MHIVHVCPWPVPPVHYGGINRFVFWLSREQARTGHDITVLSGEGTTIAELVPGVRHVPYELGEDYLPRLPDDADVVHLHVTPPAGQLPDVPFLVTHQGNRKRPTVYAPNTVFASRRHAQNHRAALFVYNGIAKEDYPLQTEKEPYLLFLAKLAWRAKNAKTAIHLALDAGVPLKITGGGLWRTSKIWGLWMARAALRRRMIEDVGLVGGEKKLRLIQNARFLFFLVNWEEPGALAPLEALACGTPVLATPNGVLPEYIEQDKNGFLVSSYGEAVETVKRIMAMGPEETAALARGCRDSVRSIEDTAREYGELYERVIRDRYLYPPEHAARFRFRRPRSTIVKWRPFARA